MAVPPGLRRLAALTAVTAIGGSQILFEILVGNPDHFPRGAGFHAWTLVWVFVLPLLVLAGVEALLLRRWGEERAWRAWRAALYGLLAASFCRQVQAHHAEAIDRVLRLELVFPLTLLIGAAAGWASFRSREKAHRFVEVLGLLGLLLVGLYVARAGLLGPAWRDGAQEAGAPPAVRGEGSPVWILLCDELSYAAVAGEAGPDPAFPALASLARDGLWFRDATTNHQWTHQAVPTLLTGRRTPPEGAPTLFQRLPATRSALIIDPWLPTGLWVKRYGAEKARLYFRGRAESIEGRPFEIARCLGRTFSESAFVRLPAGVARRQGLALYDTLEEEVDVLLDSVDPAAAPGRVTYWHCPLPHQPFTFGRDGRPRESPVSFLEVKPRPPEEVQALWGAYREQIGCFDRILGRFLDRLKERGLYEGAVIVLTSDHGLRTFGAMEPAGYPGRRSGLVPRVPLLLKAPGLAPGVSDVEYQHIDFLPTLAELLGLPGGAGEAEGRSALSGERPARRKDFSDREGWFDQEGTDAWKARGK